ncbi:methyl-accepting chemotaxis protein [Paenibacillus sp. SI8]|uniref:methyl-accepting chemotaxis protein n=1 Tax=unclassified Paenibacillus TaxID=185978 RepID=UPI003465021E
MSRFFFPVLYVLNRLKYSQKFALIGVLILLPCAITLYFLVAELNKGIVFAEMERYGLAYNNAMNKVLSGVQESRRLSYAALNGDAASKDKLTAAGAVVDEQIKQVDALEQKLGAKLDTTGQWSAFKTKWQDLKTKLPNLKLQESYDLHTELAADSLALIAHVGDKSNLILDPELDCYYLMDASLLRFPALTEDISQLRELGSGIERRKLIAKEEKTMLIYKQATVTSNANAVSAGAQVIYDKNPQLKPKLEAPIQQWGSTFAQLIAGLDSNLIAPDKIAGNGEAFMASATKAVEDIESLYTLEASLLDSRLLERVDHYTQIKYFVISFVIIVFLLVFYVFGAFYVSITKAVRAFRLSSLEVAKGNLLTRIATRTKDEMGEAASSFNAMIDAVKAIINASKMTADQVADSSDRIVRIAEQAAAANQQLSVIMQETVKRAETQLHGTEESSKAMSEMTIGIQRIAESASIVSDSSQDSSQSAVDGNEAMGKVIVQMESIQYSVKDTASKIHQLHDFSRQIGQIAEVIKGISSQTNLLALNASIEAARVGEHGRGFAVVANETRKLAEQSAASVSGIYTLLQQIQEMSAQSVDMMDNVQKDVQLGHTVVQEAGVSFGKILKSTHHIAEQIQDVSAASEQIAAGSQETAAVITEIAGVTKESSEQFKSISELSVTQRSSMEELANQAVVLNQMSRSLREQIGKWA